MSELWDRVVTDLAFLDVVCEESKRSIHCAPHRVDEIRAAIDRLGAADTFTVVANPACPAGQLLVFDDNAIAAAHEEFLQGLRSRPWRLGGLT